MGTRTSLHRPVHTLALLAALAGGVVTSAVAAPPANVTGSWTVLVGTEYTMLDITNQGGAGAPGATQCRAVIGTIGGIAPIRGQYCPASGRLSVLHNNLSTGATVRTFFGNVSEDTTNGTMHIAGTYTIFASVFGELGEYPFSAVK